MHVRKKNVKFLLFLFPKNHFLEKKICSACGTKIFNVFFSISQNHFFQGKKCNACEKDEIGIFFYFENLKTYVMHVRKNVECFLFFISQNHF